MSSTLDIPAMQVSKNFQRRMCLKCVTAGQLHGLDTVISPTWQKSRSCVSGSHASKADSAAAKRKQNKHAYERSYKAMSRMSDGDPGI